MLLPLSHADFSNVEVVAFDIDDTFSSSGKIIESAFSSLWKLHKAGFTLIPVTGRPAGWCDHIARFWPVDGVIGENGAFVFYMKNGVRTRYDITPSDKRLSDQKKLKELHTLILEKYPFAKVASDQRYREYDLAIDICEDVETWKRADVDGLIALAQKSGAHAKLSSIHVNIWFGDYTKQSAVEALLEHSILEKKLPPLTNWIFVGDSPNDAPAFKFFTKSVGVANILKFKNDLEAFPTYVTTKESGEGFTELSEILLRTKGA